MDNPFAHLLPKEADSNNNTTANPNPFAHLLPASEQNKFQLTEEGDPLNTFDANAINPFAHLLPDNDEPETIDDDSSLWEKVGFATKLGLSDTVRGVSQLTDKNLGFGDTEQMKADQEKLYEYMQGENGGLVMAAYFGGAILDPASWLIPVAKTRTLYKAAKYGFITAGIAGGLGYVDEESYLDTRGKQAAASALGGTIIAPIATKIARSLKGKKTPLGLPGSDDYEDIAKVGPTTRTPSDVEAEIKAAREELSTLEKANKKIEDTYKLKKPGVFEEKILGTGPNIKEQTEALKISKKKIKPNIKKAEKLQKKIKKLEAEKEKFLEEPTGIEYAEPSVKAKAEAEFHRTQLQGEAGKIKRDKFARSKIEVQEDEFINDIPINRTNLLRGPRAWFRENVVKAYQKNVGKPAWNMLSKGEYGTGAAGGVYGYVAPEDDAPITTKIGLAFTGALVGYLGIKGAKAIPRDSTFGIETGETKLVGKGESAKAEPAIETIKETWGDIIGRNFVDGYGLPKNFKTMYAEAQGHGNHIGQKFISVAKKIQQNFTEDERKILFNMLEGDVNHKVRSEALINLSKEARDNITEIAQEYVDLGLLKPETFLKNKNQYLKRSYINFVDDRKLGEELRRRGLSIKVSKKEYNELYKNQKAYTTTSHNYDKKYVFSDIPGEGEKELLKNHRGWELYNTSQKQFDELADNDLVQIRWDYTKPQRIGIGEIEDAAFAMAETGRAFQKTIVRFRFYNNIAKSEWAHDTLESVPVALRNTYKEMPSTTIQGTIQKRYGNLAGKFVPDEVYKNLITTEKYLQRSQNAFYKGYKKLNSYWKVSKTAWNPTVHVNNVMSNFILHDLVDADFKFLPKAWTALRTHGKKNKAGKIQQSKLVLDAQKNGVFDADFVSVELEKFQTTLINPYKYNESVDVLNNSVNTASQIYKEIRAKNILSNATEWYRFEDQVFRLSVYQDRLAKGYSPIDAALDARKSFVDYNIDAPVINMLRNTATPFLAYTYRIIPILAETAVMRPWKYAKYAVLGYGLNWMGDIVGGGNEDAERAVMPERKQGRFMDMPFMPHRNLKFPVPAFGEGKEAKPVYVNLTRWVPGGDIFDMGNPGIPGLPAPLQPSFGLGGEVLFPMLGYDLFKGEKIKGQTGILADDFGVRAEVLRDKIIPNIPFLPGSYSSKKLEMARKGEESPFKTQQSELLTLFNTLGFKFEQADVQKLASTKVLEMKRKLKGYKEQIRITQNKYRNGLINEKTLDETLDKILDKIGILSDKYNVKLDLADSSVFRKPLTIPNPFEKKN